MSETLQNQQTEDRLKVLKMHAQMKLCKLWSEATQQKENKLKIVKLNKELIDDFFKKTQLKVQLQEKIEILSIMCLIMDNTIPNKEKEKYLNGTVTAGPLSKIFKNVATKTFKKEVEKVEITKIVKQILNEVATEKGILGNYLLPQSFLTKSVNDTLSKGFKIFSKNKDIKQPEIKEQAVVQQDSSTAPKDIQENTKKDFKNDEILTEQAIVPHDKTTAQQEVQKTIKEGLKTIEIKSLVEKYKQTQTWKEKILEAKQNKEKSNSREL